MNLLRNIWVGALLLTSALIPVPCVGLEAPEVKFFTEGFDNGSVYLILQWEVEHDTDHVYFVETSTDGRTWDMVADKRNNKAASTNRGHTCLFEKRETRYIRVTQTSNSANTGRHLVEVMAYRD